MLKKWPVLSVNVQLVDESFEEILLKALATFTTYTSYPALDCLSQNFVQCGQAIK